MRVAIIGGIASYNPTKSLSTQQHIGDSAIRLAFINSDYIVLFSGFAARLGNIKALDFSGFFTSYAVTNIAQHYQARHYHHFAVALLLSLRIVMGTTPFFFLFCGHLLWISPGIHVRLSAPLRLSIM